MMHRLTNSTTTPVGLVDLHSIIQVVGGDVSVIRADTSTVPVTQKSTQDLCPGYITAILYRPYLNSYVPAILIELYTLS
jgi:hypothetical protein